MAFNSMTNRLDQKSLGSHLRLRESQLENTNKGHVHLPPKHQNEKKDSMLTLSGTKNDRKSVLNKEISNNKSTMRIEEINEKANAKK